jgi:hypothetical protein
MITHEVKTNEFGQVLHQSVCCWEVRFSDHPPDAKYRRSNQSCMVICREVEEAIQIIREKHPHDLRIYQVVMRDRDMPMVIADSALKTS